MRLQLGALVVLAGVAVCVTASSAAGADAPKYSCLGAQVTLFDNSNPGQITYSGSPPTFSTQGKVYCLTYIQTYHWNGGNGATPGQLGVTRVGADTGEVRAGQVTRQARFAAQGSDGQDGPNENWYADVPLTNPVVLSGSYQCYDSGQASWSANATSGGQGFCIVYAVPAVVAGAAASTPAATTTPTTTAASGPTGTSSSGGGKTWLWALLAGLAALTVALAAARNRVPKPELPDALQGIWDVLFGAPPQSPVGPPPPLAQSDPGPGPPESTVDIPGDSAPPDDPEGGGPGPDTTEQDSGDEHPDPGGEHADHPKPPPAILTADPTFDPPEPQPTTDIPGDSAPPDDDVL